MAGLELMPFADEHLDEAARLLAERQARHRAAEPLLPSAYEQEVAARAAVEEAWRTEGASGAVAARNGRIVGYMVAAPKTAPLWGQNAWVDTAGHAVDEAETLRDVYAAAAAPWVEAGAARHYALVPATDAELVDAWFRVGFGQQQALGIQEVPPSAEQPARVRVRLATTDDVEALVPLDLLGEYQAGPPVFSPTPSPDPDELRAELAEELADSRAAMVVAELDDRLVGLATAAPVEYSSLHSGLARPEEACVLGYAATLPEVRGSGAGVAVTNGVFDWAREHGYRAVVVDWRVTNLLASRFWPARGFRTTFLRLYRSLP